MVISAKKSNVFGNASLQDRLYAKGYSSKRLKRKPSYVDEIVREFAYKPAIRVDAKWTRMAPIDDFEDDE